MLGEYCGRRWFYGLGVFICSAIALEASCTLAQSNIVPDNTLGTENSNVIPNFNGRPIEVIDGGALRGQNLFHSFVEFNVSEGRGAYFYSPNVQNIVTRVTGSDLSAILGTLGTFGNSKPNLFFINPNGIIFGPNASLDVEGSFVATTAHAIGFGNTGIFSTKNPEAPSSLLTINPTALLFNQITGLIQNNSTARAGSNLAGFDAFGLRVPNGKSLVLVGGNISMDGGQLNAYGGRVELGGLAEPGTVALSIDGNNFSLGFPAQSTRADVSLTNRARVYVEAAGGGSIASLYSTGDVRGIPSTSTSWKKGDPIVEPTGVYRLADGRLLMSRECL